MRGYVDPSPSRPIPTYHPDLSSGSDTSSAEESSASSSSAPKPYHSTSIKTDLSRPKPAKPGRPPKDPAAREKKRLKKVSLAGVGGDEGEGLHVCVTCGRTDSPEWRKGPLGPKTLCNVRLRNTLHWTRCAELTISSGVWAAMGEAQLDTTHS